MTLSAWSAPTVRSVTIQTARALGHLRLDQLADRVPNTRADIDRGLLGSCLEYDAWVIVGFDEPGDGFDDISSGPFVGGQCQVCPVVCRLPFRLQIPDSAERIVTREHRSLNRLVGFGDLRLESGKQCFRLRIECYDQRFWSAEERFLPDIVRHDRTAAGCDDYAACDRALRSVC